MASVTVRMPSRSATTWSGGIPIRPDSADARIRGRHGVAHDGRIADRPGNDPNPLRNRTELLRITHEDRHVIACGERLFDDQPTDPAGATHASVPVVLAYLERNGERPMMFGFGSMAGPFEQLGPEAFSALGWTFVGVCATDVVAGVALCRGRRWGARLGLATSPFALALALALGAGFALPLVIVGVPIRVALVLVGRRSLA